VRGSIPTPAGSEEVRDKIRRALKGAAGVDLSDPAAIDAYLNGLSIFHSGVVGGNSACVELRACDTHLIFDCGSGMRPLGLNLMATEFGKGQGTAHIFIGHTHWDHLMGFPFFVPAYVPGNTFHFYGCHDNLEQRIRDQHVPEHFPVALDAMAAAKHFHELEPERTYDIGGVSITPFHMFHPGRSFGYRVECDNRAFVYASDTEFKSTKEKDTRFLKNADVLVLDTMYTFDEAMAKTDWGHCSPFIGTDIALAENVKKLVLFHHEPTYTDKKLEHVLKKAITYKEKMAPESALEI
jgi:phosphoribosyl 1,2-cyclic phosphodiesterase